MWLNKDTAIKRKLGVVSSSSGNLQISGMRQSAQWRGLMTPKDVNWVIIKHPTPSKVTSYCRSKPQSVFRLISAAGIINFSGFLCFDQISYIHTHGGNKLPNGHCQNRTKVTNALSLLLLQSLLSTRLLLKRSLRIGGSYQPSTYPPWHLDCLLVPVYRPRYQSSWPSAYPDCLPFQAPPQSTCLGTSAI